ncbi:MAG: hypothetical protein EZS28_028915 [Streblomastix strix]|uniref:Uncharacterized protein n=1 Tax=Streblomastix strix TaxID=222440 RepID=A0A5J4UYT5_9EUKA|nr:MAG: hypothetical protein EZS28_028915 [Streblomastix strix]
MEAQQHYKQFNQQKQQNLQISQTIRTTCPFVNVISSQSQGLNHQQGFVPTNPQQVFEPAITQQGFAHPIKQFQFGQPGGFNTSSPNQYIKPQFNQYRPPDNFNPLRKVVLQVFITLLKLELNLVKTRKKKKRKFEIKIKIQNRFNSGSAN